jgi:Flp pilus assembly protein TadG
MTNLPVGCHTVLMRWWSEGVRARRCADRGAVAVEAALILPMLIVLALGIAEFGLLAKNWLSATSAVRAGVRVASAEPGQTTFATDAAAQVATALRDFPGADDTNPATNPIVGLWVYKAGAGGLPDSGTFQGCTTCVRFNWNAATLAFNTPGYNNWAASSHHSCPGDAAHDSVGVFLQLRHDAATGLFFQTWDIGEHAVMALEPDPAECY